MNPKPGLYPSEQPRNTDSKTEIAVYNALKESLPSGWYAWHSLRLMDDDGTFGEGDFVIANPDRGLLVLEVKGGSIEQRDGRWFQNGAPMKIDPLAQAHRFVRKLIHRLELSGCYPPAYGVATCFPDTAFETPPDQSDLRDTTIGKKELAWLEKALPALFDKALPASRRPRGKWIEQIHGLWGDTWIPALRLGTRSEIEDSDRVKLDAEQMRILQMIERNTNLLIQGGAGSGKTLVAREAAVRFAASGERVLFLCFTRALAEWLRGRFTSANLQVSTLGQYALDLVRLVEPGLKEPTDMSGWRELIFRAAAEAAPQVSGTWDAVIVDEAQDLAEFDWELVFELARNKRLWVFHDPAQHFWDDRPLPKRLTEANFFKLDLPQNHRCDPAIIALADCYRIPENLKPSKPILREGIANETIGVVECPSESSVPDRIANEIGKLRSAGFAPDKIAIISVRGQTGARTFGMDRIGAYRLVKADDPNATREIVDDTFLRFKGLERPAVIVTDLNLIADRREKRMYIAITRALSTVRVVAPAEAIRSDPILAALMS
ncbi:NERD domain-containing protein [bacterium]|nr:NERD domain-containing protein [bacterium]